MPMKKILLVSGCSNTDKNFESAVHPEMDCSWPKWPELLAKKLDMECVNLAHNGAGNEYIYSTILEYILKTKDKSQIGLVIPAWTQCQRKDYQESHLGTWHQKRIDPDGDVFSFVRKDLRYMISLQLICKLYNIPLKMFQMISFFDGFITGLSKTDAEVYKNRNNPNFKRRYNYNSKSETKQQDRLKCSKIMLEYEPYIDVKDFIGWPTSNHFGGFHIESKTLWLDDGGEYNEELLVSKLDVHPGKKGHEKIAEFLYDWLG